MELAMSPTSQTQGVATPPPEMLRGGEWGNATPLNQPLLCIDRV